jgi:hypothetical protein
MVRLLMKTLWQGEMMLFMKGASLKARILVMIFAIV